MTTPTPTRPADPPSRADAPGLRFTGSDLFASPAQTLVNPVNTEGVMGAGLALAFRAATPRSSTTTAAAAPPASPWECA